MMPLRTAVIGLGVGEQHLTAYRAHPDCVVTALCDNDPAKLRYAAERYPEIPGTAVADELLRDPDIDVVSIATYDDVHAEQVITALRHGKHVFVEKPLCLSDEEAHAIREVKNAHPELQLSSNLVLRASPRFQAARRLVQSGQLGQLYHVEGDYLYGRKHKLVNGWRGRIDDYSVVCGGAVHLIDLLTWLSGARVASVTAVGTDLPTRGSVFSGHALTVALLQFAGGLVGKVSADYACVHPHFHALRLYGSAGTFINGQPDATLITAGPDGPTPAPVTDAYQSLSKGVLLHSFIEALRGRGKPAVSEEEVFSVLSICLAIDQAARCREPVPVHYY